MIITTDLIKSLNPCKDRLGNFLLHYGSSWQGTHREFAALVNISYEDKMWVMIRLVSPRDYDLYRKSGAYFNSPDNELNFLLNCLDSFESPSVASKEEVNFQVGDKVSAFGVEGIVTRITDAAFFPIKVDFPDDINSSFTIDGRYLGWHKEPSLKLIERPKKKVKKYKVLFKGTVGGFFVSAGVYSSAEDFVRRNPHSRLIQLIKESEIEVEE